MKKEKNRGTATPFESNYSMKHENENENENENMKLERRGMKRD